jgi:hypothetical protein
MDVVTIRDKRTLHTMAEENLGQTSLEKTTIKIYKNCGIWKGKFFILKRVWVSIIIL